MTMPLTPSGYNMYDMLSMVQKSIRRAKYEYAAFAANELQNVYRSALWNRLLVISCEDCFGILTKEILSLKEKDEKKKDSRHISNAVALLCKAKKSRDACYFACNFVLTSRKPREIEVENSFVKAFKKIVNKEYDRYGFYQLNLFDMFGLEEEEFTDDEKTGAALEIAIEHLDMDMIGYYIDILRRKDRKFLWDVLKGSASKISDIFLEPEINALEKADIIINARKKDLEKDEIFISKAVMLMCYYIDRNIEVMFADKIIDSKFEIEWDRYSIKPIEECSVSAIPEWVYDCHTIKGRKMGKTDWDMTKDEQAALYPLKKAYFDEASWLYTYEQDYAEGHLSEKLMSEIRKYAENHEANPVKFLSY